MKNNLSICGKITWLCCLRIITTERDGYFGNAQVIFPQILRGSVDRPILHLFSLRHYAWQLGGLLALLFASPGYGQMIVAHRGASFDAPENTLAAFNEAWQQQADGIEGDFYVTRDQQIVCIHDKDALRTAGKKLVVKSSTLAELRQLEYGRWKSAEFAGEPIPTFMEVLECVPEGKLFVIELKTGPEIVPLLKAELDRKSADLTNLLIIAFDADTVARCKELLPAVRAHWLTGYERDALGHWQPSVAEIAETLARCHADGLGTKGDREVVTSEFIADLKRRGMREFHVWTIDEPLDAKYFQQLGAVGITTNRPAFIRKALANP